MSRFLLLFYLLYSIFCFFSYLGCCSEMCGCFCPCFKKNGDDFSNTGKQNNNIQNPIINNQNNNTQNIDHKNDEIINEPDTKIIDSEDEFKSDFNNEFTIFISNFSEEVKNKCTDNNIPDYVLGDYWNMYQQMTSEEEIFTHEAAMSLLCYRELLRIWGIVYVLKKLFKDKNRVTWWPGMGSECGVIYRNVVCEENKDEKECAYPEMYLCSKSHMKKKIKEQQLLTKELGGIYIDNDLFKGLRCNGNPCNSVKFGCVSCLLRDLLRKEGLYNFGKDSLFFEIYSAQSCDSQSSFSIIIKSLIYDMIKERYKSSNYINRFEKFLSRLKSCKDIKKINYKYNIKDIQKSIMIEWALTVEFLKYFLPVMSEDKKLTLYRTIHKNQYENGDYGNKRDLFESTSIFGPVYEGKYGINTFVQFDLIIYRCVFSYFVSPNEKTIFHFIDDKDYEMEVGYINIGLPFKRINDKKTDNYEHYIERCKFLQDEFIKICKQNFVKTKEFPIGSTFKFVGRCLEDNDGNLKDATEDVIFKI